MKRIRYWLLISTALLATFPALAAEETPAAGDTPTAPSAESEADSSKRRGWMYIELAEWFSQPVGTDYRWANVYRPEDSRGGAIQSVEHGTTENERWRLGWIFKNPDAGRVLVTYWANVDETYEQLGFPGQFIIGESATLPIYAGAFDDGFADLAEVGTATKTRDTRLDYGWTISQNKRVETIGLVGVRWVDHSRTMDARYYGWDANFPFVGGGSSERLDLVPLPDFADLDSRYSGRGLDLGIEARVSLHPKVRIDVSLSAAILRGSTDSNYSWSNAYYVLETGGEATYVDPDLLYQYLDDPETEPFIQQVEVGSAIHEDGVSTTSWVADASVAVHGEVYRGIEVFAGFRGAHYDSVGADLRADPQAVEGWTRAPRSVGYEGFFAGMAFRF